MDQGLGIVLGKKDPGFSISFHRLDSCIPLPFLHAPLLIRPCLNKPISFSFFFFCGPRDVSSAPLNKHQQHATNLQGQKRSHAVGRTLTMETAPQNMSLARYASNFIASRASGWTKASRRETQARIMRSPKPRHTSYDGVVPNVFVLCASQDLRRGFEGRRL